MEITEPPGLPVPLRTLCFRDLGGLATGDGRQIRPGRVFRSSGLEELSSEDVDLLLTKVGLATVIDLRDAAEIAADGAGPLAETAVRYVHLPFTPPDEGRPRGTLLERYRSYLELGGPAIRQVLATIADTEALPVVFHCLAGKDRTGILSAMLLGAVGIRRDAIVADYSDIRYSRQDFQRFLQRRASCSRIRDEDFESHLFDAPPEVMGELLRDLDGAYGGIRPYLLAIGLEPEVLPRLEALLLEPVRP